MDEPYIKFDQERFKNVVHFVISRCSNEKLGKVKLHRILYFSDMFHFMETGEPLTGVDYLKQRFGPMARYLNVALDQLEQEGLVEIKSRKFYGFDKKDYISKAIPDPTKLGNDAQVLLADVIDFVVEQSAREFSELSHDAAYDAAEMGERIPYAAVFGFQSHEVTPEEVDECKSLLQKLRPLIEAERSGSRVL